MAKQAIVSRRHVLEYVVGSEPTVDGDYVRNLLILGPVSVNPDDPKNPNSPKRNYRSIIGATEEVVKFNGRPSFVMHAKSLGRARTDADKIGDFLNARSTPDGIRADLLCRKMVVEGKEVYHPQAAAIRDNIESNRPFGGFSPTLDYQINTYTGEVKRIDQVESIDYVANPATVRSVIEEEEKEEKAEEENEADENDAEKSEKEEKAEVTKEDHEKLKGEHEALKTDHESLRNEHGQLEEKMGSLLESHEALSNKHAALEERMKSCEEAMAGTRKEATEAKEAAVAARKGQSRVIPETKKLDTGNASSFKEFIRT